jgi:hypothetical protein
MHIVIVGDPINGFAYYGPFDSKDDADRYIDQGNAGDDTAWHVILTTPYTDGE